MKCQNPRVVEVAIQRKRETTKKTVSRSSVHWTQIVLLLVRIDNFTVINEQPER